MAAADHEGWEQSHTCEQRVTQTINMVSATSMSGYNFETRQWHCRFIEFDAAAIFGENDDTPEAAKARMSVRHGRNGEKARAILPSLPARGVH